MKLLDHYIYYKSFGFFNYVTRVTIIEQLVHLLSLINLCKN